MESTLSSLTGQLPHVTDVYYYFLCYHACLFKKKIRICQASLHSEPGKGAANSRTSSTGPSRGSSGQVITDALGGSPKPRFPLSGVSPSPTAGGWCWQLSQSVGWEGVETTLSQIHFCKCSEAPACPTAAGTTADEKDGRTGGHRLCWEWLLLVVLWFCAR